MSVKMMNDKPIADTNSTGKGSYMPLLKRGCNPMQWRVHGLLPATKNFTSATNYL